MCFLDVWKERCPCLNSFILISVHGGIFPFSGHCEKRTRIHSLATAEPPVPATGQKGSKYTLLGHSYCWRAGRNETRDAPLLPSIITRLYAHSWGSWLPTWFEEEALLVISSDDCAPAAYAEWLITVICNFPLSDSIISQLSVLIFWSV